MTTTERSTEEPQVVGREAWIEAQRTHLVREKELTRLRDELSAERRALPRLEVTEASEFAGPAASAASEKTSLLDLFEGRSQLLIYHFMYGPDWGDEGCPSCSFWADNFNDVIVHLAHRDVTMKVVSRATSPQIEAYQRRMGWDFDWYSSEHSEFNFDMGVSHRAADLESGDARYNFGTQDAGGDESPGISVFTRTDDGRIFLTYQTFSRGLDLVNGAYHLLDLTSKGRDEGGLEWTMQWLHRHDAYED